MFFGVGVLCLSYMTKAKAFSEVSYLNICIKDNFDITPFYLDFCAL